MTTFTKIHCNEWLANPLINPVTKKTIKKDGPTYNKIASTCKHFEIQINKPIPYNIDDKYNNFYLDTRKLKIEIIQKNFPNNSKNPIDILKSSLITYVETKGSGSFGKVSILYSSSLKFDFVLKQAKITVQDLELVKKDLFPEINIMKWLNFLVYENKSINVPLIYSYSYNNQFLKLVKGVRTKNSLNILMEKFDGTLKDIFLTLPSEELAYNLLLQCLLNLATLQHVFGLVHFDIKSINILYKKVLPGGYWKYNFRGDTYYVENMGYIMAIADFGLAYFSRPFYSFTGIYKMKEYGRRIVEIIGNNTKLINHKYCIQLISHKFPKRIEPFSPCCCMSNNVINTMPEIPIDFDDLDRFPPYDFLRDNLDIIRTFIGGKRASQRGYHSGYTFQNTNKKIFLKESSEVITENISIKDVLKIQNFSYMYSGKKLLKKIFSDKMVEPRNKGNLLNVFTIN